MQMRTTCPSNNPYYMRKASGGYSNAIKGCPTIKGADVLCNCVGYANGRFGEIQDLGYIKYQLVCNAENFIEKAKSMGLEISAVPVLGGIMVWQRGATLSGNDGAGHVAVVEKVINAGQIITSESGYNAWAFKTVTRSNSKGRWGQSSAYKFRGCIVNPAIGRKGAEEIKSIDVDGYWGVMTTLFSQQIMKTYQDGFVSGQLTSCKKYLLNALDSSWEFSAKGKGSPLIKAIQKLVGASQDGFAGQNTIKAMQRFLKTQGYYNGSIDGYMGSGTVKGWQKWLNNPTYKKETKQEKAVEYAEKLANDNSYHYVVYNTKDAKTKECPICHNFPAGKYRGFNCIRFVFTCWYHAGIPCKHEGGLINNAIGQKMYDTKSDAEALKLAQDAIGCKSIKIIRNKNGIALNSLEIGDACMHFESGVYKHIYLYAGNGNMVDCGNWKDVSQQIAIRKASSRQIVIRYIGD